jgi:flagellar basal body rod protein FlgG
VSDIFQIAAVGMLEGKERLEAISQNAANASLPGYRRQVVSGHSFNAALLNAAPTDSASLATIDTTQRIAHQVNLRRGATLSTGRALDVSIDPDDLFFALTDGTHTWLTRGGAFRIDDGGVLVGERGLRVVGTQGGDVHLPSSDVQVEADGKITHQGETVAALQLFRPAAGSSLFAASGALLEAPAGVEPAEQSAVRMRGGMLEASNTDNTREMLGLIELSRQFEGLSRVLQSYDEMLGRAIEKIGGL